MDGLPLEPWSNFFIAEAGAAAALSGLLFVATAINLARILDIPHLPGRAADSLVMLIGVLVVCSFGLVPAQPPQLLAAEFIATGVALWFFHTRQRLRSRGRYQPDSRWKIIVPVMLGQAATIPFVIAGAVILAGHPSGLYWLAPGVVCCFISAVWNAWVLLVEIMR
jgi:hypothetical protein